MAPGQGWFGFLMIAVGVMLLSAFQFLRIRLQHANLFLHYSIAEVARNVAWVVMVVSALYLVPKEAFWGELALGLLVVASLIVVLAFRWIMPSEKHVIDDRNWLPDLYPSLHAARYVIAYTLVAAIVPFVPFAVVTWFLDD